MGQLEWYHGIEAAHQHSAYTLAWRLCRNEETVVKGFIRTAVDIAYKSVRRRDRRMRANDVRWKITLSDPQLLQIAILEAPPRGKAWRLGSALGAVHCASHAVYSASELRNGDWKTTFREWYPGFRAAPQQVAACPPKIKRSHSEGKPG